MKSPHLLMSVLSLFLMIGLARAVPLINSADDELNAQPLQLVARIQPLLPPGTNLEAASLGFKNPGQFIAAVHVAHNLDIPFDRLRGRLTGADAISLGAAIRELKPAVNAEAEVRKAEAQAHKDQQTKK